MTPLDKKFLKDLEAVLARPVPESCRWKSGTCATYGDVVRILQEAGAKVFIVGGAVRDIASGRADDVTDLDINVRRANKDAFVEALKKNGIVGYVIDTRENVDDPESRRFFYSFIGCDASANVDIKGSVRNARILEVPCNSMMIDMAEMTLIDPTGVGVADALSKTWRIPPHLEREDDREAWAAEEGVQRLWRMIKFRENKGFSVPEADQKLIYRVAGREAEAGKATPYAIYRLVYIIKDPAVWACAIASDAAAGRVSGAGAAAILRAIFDSKQVVVPAVSATTKSFAMICDQRKKNIRSREAKREEARQQGRVRKRDAETKGKLNSGRPAKRGTSNASRAGLANPSR